MGRVEKEGLLMNDYIYLHMSRIMMICSNFLQKKGGRTMSGGKAALGAGIGAALSFLVIELVRSYVGIETKETDEGKETIMYMKGKEEYDPNSPSIKFHWKRSNKEGESSKDSSSEESNDDKGEEMEGSY